MTWNGTKAELVDGCHLPGDYVQVAEKRGPRVLHSAKRPLFLPDEIPEECQTATHLFAAFVTSGARDIKAILLPLPCPSVHDVRPARGCLGRGLSGAERLAKGRALNEDYQHRASGDRDLARELDIYSLIPDDDAGLERIYPVSDLDLRAHGLWVSSHYERVALDPPEPPFLRRIREVRIPLPSSPIFRLCFSGFEPDFIPDVIF